MENTEKNLYDVMRDMFKDMLEASLKPTNNKIDSLDEKMKTIQGSLKIVNLFNDMLANSKAIVAIITILTCLTGYFATINYNDNKNIQILTQEVQLNHQEIAKFIASQSKKK